MQTALLLATLGGCTVPTSLLPVDGGASDLRMAPTASAIKHLVILSQENHTFDVYFGDYCRAAVGSKPTCNDGPACCEAGPERDPGTGKGLVLLTDAENGAFSPDHTMKCEVDEIHGGLMDRFVEGACGNPRNFARVDPALIAPYRAWAATYAMGDRYFQPIAGGTAANNMYMARASYVFTDNQSGPRSIGSRCLFEGEVTEYTDQTIGDLLNTAGVDWTYYIEGYEASVAAEAKQRCPEPPPDCAAGIPFYPCVFDPSDIPFQYYPNSRDHPAHIRDYARLKRDVAAGRLPAVSWVKALGYRTEHPAAHVTISDGVAFVKEVVDFLDASAYAGDTLILFTYDEGGGYFDHVAPPAASRIDKQPYGTRVPFLALGRFAKRNYVSHVVMEHSSLVKFIEWNWLGQKTGQLGTRDAVVNNIGSVLDPAATGVAVPER